MIDVSILNWLRALPASEPVAAPVRAVPERGRAAAADTTPGPMASGDRVEISAPARRLQLESRVRGAVLAELRRLAQPDRSASDEVQPQ
jgi:hypothetical protein